ncbi:RNA-binding protein 25 isoform X2 [Oncorhynchus mykiss]|uniref:RNA-binding protein 25 isoform X2 n=1 Tax=Oncorhynchus mykiss TaxID=8022 RepID=UPI0018788421|nr:RNA-binding protein 25 isoform X2 [Oncorhynchus mykiss]
MSYPPHLNRLPQLPPGIRPPHFAGFPQGVPAGTPMIPVHMGIMTSAPTVLVPTTVSMVQKPPAQRKELNPVRAKENQEGGSGPTTTVFVGNISEKASDMLVRQLLAKCGLVLSWKRVQGASGKLQAFGFCEYKEPESTLRSLRLLHELLLGDKKLLVKVDAKTKAQLEEWKARKRNSNGGAMSEDGLKEEEEEEEEEDLDEDTKRRDQIVKGAIEGLIREYGSELNAPSQDGDNQPRKKKREKKEEEDINVMEMEDDKRDLISREISKFRDTHKKLEEEKGKKEQERQEIDKDRRERDKERERERERRDREREKEKERNDNIKERERDRDRDRIDRERERTKERERERGERERGERERGERERGERERGERERVKERSREVSKDRSKSRERSRDEKKHDREEDQEEAYERRKLERKMRDKETAYQERLKNWEIRERKKARDYDKENQREEERRHEMTKEAKRLKEFLEDYDDDRDESKYYRGSALQKRLRDREKETELDDRDRKREKEEHDQIRQRLLAEGHPDPEAELQRMEEEAERRRQPPVKPEEEVQQEKPHREREHREHREREHREREHHRDRRGGGGGGGADRPPPEHPQSQSDDDVEDGEELDDRDGDDSSDARTHPHLKPTLRPITSAPSVSSGSGGATPNSPGNESPCGIIIPHENSPDAQPTDEHRPKIGLSLKLGAGASPSHQVHTGSKRKKLANVDSVFNKFGEEEADEAPRKRKLVPLDYGEDDKSLGLDGAEVPGGKGGQNTEEKRKHIRSLIEKIPTARPELFNYPLDWTAVDSTLMDRRIRPWINKKIIEYIGEEEATLVDFVCSKVMSHGTPQGILDDVAMVLDEEAEVFIVKMWRLLIYETEAKKIGLGK